MNHDDPTTRARHGADERYFERLICARNAALEKYREQYHRHHKKEKKPRRGVTQKSRRRQQR